MDFNGVKSVQKREFVMQMNHCNELETQTPWKHAFSCMSEDCISYFGEPDAV